MFVRLTETREINTPDDPSPASVDSPASLASLARRDPKPEEKNRKESEKKEPDGSRSETSALGTAD